MEFFMNQKEEKKTQLWKNIKHNMGKGKWQKTFT